MTCVDVEEMTGKERRKHMMNKLETLGAKVCKMAIKLEAIVLNVE